jgi:regulator of nucleoside diphosphate kinase
VTFAYDGSPYRAFKLVFPYEADIARGRISVLTLVGAMLLGLSEGQTMDWVGADGRTHRLLVEKVGARPDEPQTPRPAAMEVRVGR